jgi:hypothetical protein
LNWVRARLRRWFFSLFRRTWQTDEGKSAAVDALRGLLGGRPELDLPSEQPYADLGRAHSEREAGKRLAQGERELDEQSAPVFITARFRSGSTLLWNLFRQLDGFTSYYEPFNERRWFDPKHRGSRIDPTHRGVSDYWMEYEGLTELGQLYDEAWIDRDLYMGPHAWHPAMKRYVEVLIERAPGRAALQFNRIDFRLPWFRRTFPHARIVHLFRHPRDQWLSALTEQSIQFPRNGTAADFRPHDHFYLLNWCRDMRYHFPFLDERLVEHPYQLHYYIWKLSYLFGRKYADHSVGFEALSGEPAIELPKLLSAVGVGNCDLAKLTAIISPPPVGKWREYADDAWFSRHESICETTLADWLRA